MPQVQLTDPARHDIRLALAWSAEQFGDQATRRYEALIAQAIRALEIAAEPKGSLARPELGAGIRTYHLSYSRYHVSRAIGRVNRPRHLFAYRLIGPDRLEIVRLLHERMDSSVI